MNVTLPIELVNRILGFLSRQPYADVAQIIADIQRAANPPTPEKPTPIVSKKSNGPTEQALLD